MDILYSQKNYIYMEMQETIQKIRIKNLAVFNRKGVTSEFLRETRLKTSRSKIHNHYYWKCG